MALNTAGESQSHPLPLMVGFQQPAGCLVASSEGLGPRKGAYALEALVLIPDLQLVVSDLGQGTSPLRQLSILICKTEATVAKFQG